VQNIILIDDFTQVYEQVIFLVKYVLSVYTREARVR